MDDADDITESLQGKLLVAAPSLLDPNFNRTVVLMLAHGEHGPSGSSSTGPPLPPFRRPCRSGRTWPRSPAWCSSGDR